jgi:hypothetical protein
MRMSKTDKPDKVAYEKVKIVKRGFYFCKAS